MDRNDLDLKNKENGFQMFLSILKRTVFPKRKLPLKLTLALKHYHSIKMVKLSIFPIVFWKT